MHLYTITVPVLRPAATILAGSTGRRLPEGICYTHLMDLPLAKEWILDLIFPKLCLGCSAEGSFLCPPCRGALTFSAPTCPGCSQRNFTGILCGRCAAAWHLRRFLAPFSYRNTLVRNLIHAYKYHGVRELADLFADELITFLNFYAIRPKRPAVLVPIPLHRSRERHRGFNQAALLADALSKRLKLPVASALRRRRSTEQQIDMASYEDRHANVARAFHIADPLPVAGRTIVLIDDVATSGATLSEAAGVLRKAGAHTVWAIAIAKG